MPLLARQSSGGFRESNPGQRAMPHSPYATKSPLPAIFFRSATCKNIISHKARIVNLFLLAFRVIASNAKTGFNLYRDRMNRIYRKVPSPWLNQMR